MERSSIHVVTTPWVRVPTICLHYFLSTANDYCQVSQSNSILKVSPWSLQLTANLC